MSSTAFATATATMVAPLQFVDTSLATAAGFAPMPDLAPAAPSASARTVTLVNISSYVLRLADYDGADQRHDLPPVGAVVAPRGEIQFEVDLHALRHGEVTARFDIIGTDDQVLPHGYTLEITTEPLGGSAPWSPLLPEIIELHLTADDVGSATPPRRRPRGADAFPAAARSPDRV